MYEYELTNACLKLLRDMFMLQPGESIAITCDTETNMEVVEATAQAAVILGAKPLVLKVAAPGGCGSMNIAAVAAMPKAGHFDWRIHLQKPAELSGIYQRASAGYRNLECRSAGKVPRRVYL